MTLDHETIERQFEEMRQQYTFLENVLDGMNKANTELKRQIEGLERQNASLRDNQCQCGKDVACGC